MIVLATGSRDWQGVASVETAFCAAANIVYGEPDVRRIQHVFHGGANGLDRIAGRYGVEIGALVHVYGADWATYGRGAGPIRNAQMLNACTELATESGLRAVCLAFPYPDSRGTWDMLRRAADANISVMITPPGVW